MYNLLVGGAAGQGVDTTVSILEHYFKGAGNEVFTMRDLMSRIRGGHNFCRLRFGERVPKGHNQRLDGILALNQESVALHQGDLRDKGFILVDAKLETDDPRAVRLDLEGIAKELGNPRVSGSVAVGAVLKLFGYQLDQQLARHALKKSLRPGLVDINLQAIAAGYEKADKLFDRPGGNAQDQLLLSGNVSLAMGALAAGLQFYSAYPMSPATSILEFLAHKATEMGIVVEQAEDEIAAINMALGASFAGARSMTGTSGGGFSLKVEALGLSGMAEIPLVVVNVQRPGPVTGLPTRTEQADLQFIISASQGEFPRQVIALRHHVDAFYQTMRAFNIAEKYQIPVILLSDQFLADSTTTIPMLDPERIPLYVREEPPEGEEYARYRYTESGVSPRLFPGDRRGLVTADSDEHDEYGRIIEDAQTRTRMMDKRMGKLNLLEQELEEPDWLGDKEPDVVLIGWGSTWGPLNEAVQLLNAKEGPRYAALVFGDVWPLPVATLRNIAVKGRLLINVEQNYLGQLARVIAQETNIRMDRSILKYDGRQLTGEEIAREAAQEDEP